MTAAERARLWQYRERQPEAARFLGEPIKLDLSVPAGEWLELASAAPRVVREIDPAAQVIMFGHVADASIHLNIVPAVAAASRLQDAIFSFVADLGRSISAERGIGTLKGPWLRLVRSEA